MKRLGASLALVLSVLVALPALARDFVQDGATMFSPSTVSQLNERIGNFNAQTGKEVVVITVPSTGGQSIDTAAHQAFSQQNVNGVLIYIAKDDRKDTIVADQAGTSAGWFTPDVLSSIRQSMESQFRSEDFDGGITTAVNGVLNVYRQHVNSAPGAARQYPVTQQQTYSYPARNQGVHISMFWWIVIIVVGFLIIRSIMRAASGPRYYGGGPGVPGPGGPGVGGPGYGGPGYGGYGGPGYYGGGGGGFWSGLLGGLGGAFLGNELFGNRGGTNIIEQQPGNVTPVDQSSGGWGGGDQGGWANDPGQAGGSSSGDWGGGGFGDSGGGFGGGGGDFGGGGFGGGGDSSSGGW